MDNRLSQSVSLSALEEVSGFEGTTTLGWTSAEKLSDGNFKVSVLDSVNGRDRETAFFLDGGNGKVTFGGSEFCGTAESAIPFEPEPVSPPPFFAIDIVSAIRSEKEG